MKNLLCVLSFLQGAACLSFSQNQEDFYLLNTANGKIEIEANYSLAAYNNTNGEEQSFDGYFYKLVQFYEIPSQQKKDEFHNTGALLLSYIPSNAYIASFPVGFNFSALQNFSIRSIVSINEKLIMSPAILKKEYPAWAIKENNNIELIISCFKNIDIENAIGALNKNLFTVIKVDDYINTITIRTNLNNINTLAALPFISYIEPIHPPGEPENLPGRSNHRSNTISTEFASGRHYNGAGVNVAMFDDGRIGPHIDYTGRIGDQFTFSNGSVEHGDHVSGTIMGAGNLNPRNQGMAPGATLYVYNAAPWYDGFDSMYTHYTDPGIVITSTSYSDGCNAGYTSFSQKLDQQLRTMPSLVHVFSAGNNGASNCGYGAGSSWGNITGGHKLAKNVITVANIDSLSFLQLSSSRGPATDGRLKPDVSAVGTDVASTMPFNNYVSATGTSMSCPGVSGVMAQLYQAYKNLNGGANPDGGLMKAVLMNGCDDIGTTGPDFRHGYGKINALNSVKIIEAGNFLSSTIAQGNTNTHTIVVPAGTKQLRVMLYWTDYESSPTAGIALVNNLNLEVKDPATTTFNPWKLDHTPNHFNLSAPATRGIDNLNNVEQVTIDNPVAGTYSLTVNGFSVPQGPQNYFITYMFDDDDVTVTYPIGGEGFVPGEREIIRWDAYGYTSTFNLEYSTDNGNSWNSIASAVGSFSRNYIWTVPSVVTGQALIKITRGSSSDVSDANFTILNVPQNLTVDWACPDSIKISWDAVSGATEYEVSQLGAMYMDSIGRTATTSFVIYNTNPNLEYWFSVKALTTNNGKGRRAIAINKPAGVINCIIPYDVTVTEIISPMHAEIPSCQALSAVPVSIRINNYGANSIHTIPVNYAVNGGPAFTEIYTGTISPGANAIYTFTSNVSISTLGNYTVTAWTSHATDGNPYNDSINISGVIYTGAVQTLPYAENFESFPVCSSDNTCEQVTCTLNNGWKNVSNVSYDEIDWRTFSGSTPTNDTGPDADHNPGSTSGQYLYLESSFCSGRQAELLSPCISLKWYSSVQLSFWYHMYGIHTGSLHVDILINGSWTNDIIPVLSGDQGNTWQQATVNLTAFAGNDVTIRFRGVTGNGSRSDIAIDDILVTGIVGVPDENNIDGNITIYPNPGKNIFNISFNLLSGEAIAKLYDVQGSLILTKTISEMKDNTSELDLQHLDKGVYFLNITAEGKSCNKKIIKAAD